MFASSGLVLLLWTAPVMGGADLAAPDASVASAIARSVQRRVGEAATVTVSEVSGVRLAAGAGALLAVPEPSARIGVPARFLLSDARPGHAPVRVGEVTAVVRISAPAVRATRAIARGERLASADLAVAPSSLEGRLLQTLPSLEDAIGARATRDLSADTVLARGDIVSEPLVRAGDIVRAHARIGQVDVVADMVAAESGGRDEVIRVVNQESKHAVRARVVARGEVEVVNAR